MLAGKPNLVCFMAQKMILFRETGFVNALEIKGTIPNTNVVLNVNALNKTQDQPTAENPQDVLRPSLTTQLRSVGLAVGLKPESRLWNGNFCKKGSAP